MNKLLSLILLACMLVNLGGRGEALNAEERQFLASELRAWLEEGGMQVRNLPQERRFADMVERTLR